MSALDAEPCVFEGQGSPRCANPAFATAQGTAMNLSTRFRRFAVLAAASFAVAGPASAGDFIFRNGIEPRAVTGTMTINGFPMPVPSGAGVSGSHIAGSGTYGGKFYFPSASFTAPINGLGVVTLTVQWIHLGTSASQFFDNTTATVGVTEMYFNLQSAVVSGTPVPLSNCAFGPVTWSLVGTWNATTAQASQTGFVIPPLQGSNCSGFGTQISNSIAGSNNSVNLSIDIRP